MKKIIQRMAQAVKEKRGIRLTKPETKRLHDQLSEKDLVYGDELKELREKASCADCYLQLRRCRNCSTLHLDGYICNSCGVDDADIPKERRAS